MAAVSPALLHQHSSKDDVLPHDGGDIDLPARPLRLTARQLAKDKEYSDRDEQSYRSNYLFHFLND
jgi:hypothetical protein